MPNTWTLVERPWYKWSNPPGFFLTAVGEGSSIVVVYAAHDSA